MDYGPTSMDNVRSFLEGPHRAVLATIGRDGSPHIVVVDYLVEGDHLLVNGGVNRRWVLNLRLDPRSSALVHDPDNVSHWVRLTGRAELVREGDEAAVEDAVVMARRYGDDPEQFVGQHRVTWQLVPRQVLERTE
ncbi:MAG: TIGR03618 family F420-dependent PPOX class oxidoreductase [Acidimicrobiaceae bacterium]|nr:TIGR03618 family F420-dependent PPOX class oxidoreductase [Acidimicrobiaceae bacterium]